jgi:glycine betaine/proline transport system substrate-binding protein
VAGDTMPTFTSMNEKGMPDVAPELWSNAVVEPLTKALAEKRLIVGNKAPISGLGEGWWISPYTAKKHNLKTVADVINRPDLFPYAEDKSKGAFVTCPAGWGCQLVNNNLFRANKMSEKGWVLVDPGSAAGLDGSLNKSLTREENWFGYYWSPTTLIGKHNMFKADFDVPFVGKKHWDGCIVKSEQDCANPKRSSWTTSEVNTVITSNFKKNASVALDYIGKRVYPGSVMNSMLVYMDNEKAEGEDAAYYFLKKHENIWEKWISPDVAKKVKSSL